MIGLVTCQAAGVAGKRTTLLELRAAQRSRAHVCFVGLVVVLLVALAPGQMDDDASLFFNYDFGLSRVVGIGEYMGIASRGRKTFVVFNGTKGASSYLEPEDYVIWGSTSTWP